MPYNPFSFLHRSAERSHIIRTSLVGTYTIEMATLTMHRGNPFPLHELRTKHSIHTRIYRRVL